MGDLLATYRAQIEADFPGMSIGTARLNSDGLMNDAVIINDALVFRFAKNEQARAQLAHEAQLLQLIGRHVSAPIPRIEHLTDAYMCYRFVAGQPLYRHILLRANSATQQQLAEGLASFLQQLHSIPLGELPPRPGLAAASIRRRERYEQQLSAIEANIYPLLWADQRAWVSDLFAPVLEGSIDLDTFNPQLIHRDLAAYHVLHDPQAGQLTGVIDYGTAGAGDAAVDWACLINTYGEQFVRRIHQRYPIDQQTIDRARFYAGAIELEWALDGITSNDPSLLLVHLGRARDSWPMLTEWP